MLDRIVGEVLARTVLDGAFEACNKELELVHIEVLIQFDAADLFHFVDDGLKRVNLGFVGGFHAQYHVAVHLYETAVAVVYEVRVVGFLDHAFSHYIIEAEVEDGIHHTGHGSACAGANADQQRVGRVTEFAVHQGLDVLDSCQYIIVEEFHDFLLAYLVVLVANISCDGESGRNRNTDKVHLCAVSAFTTQFGAHRGVALCFAVTKGVNSFLVFHLRWFF